MNKKSSSVLSYILYVISVALAAYSGWAVYNSYKYVSNVISQGGLVVKGNEFEITSYYMSSAGQYVIMAIIIFSIGWILHRMPTGNTSAVLETPQEESLSDDERQYNDSDSKNNESTEDDDNVQTETADE